MFALLGMIPGIGLISTIFGGVLRFIVNCVPCMVIIAIVAAYFVGDFRGKRKEREVCKAREQAMLVAAQQRDADAATLAEEFSRKQQAEIDVLGAELKKKVDDYEQLVAKGSTAECRRATPDDVERLRGLAR